MGDEYEEIECVSERVVECVGERRGPDERRVVDVRKQII